MNANINRIKDQKEFKNIWNVINNTFDITQTLPNQVFKENVHGFLFEEFDWASTPEFWDSFLKPLALTSQEHHILVSVLDPNPIDYFYRKFDYYGSRKLSLNITGDNYFEELRIFPPENSDDDAMLFDSETVVWMPMSKKWAIWGERSAEACILAFFDNSVKEKAMPFLKTWKSAEKALDDFMCLSFTNQQVPDEFAKTLIENYPTQ